MISFLSLITLFLRLSLAIQAQVEAVADFSFSEEKTTCQVPVSASGSLYVDTEWWTGNISLSRKLENEERVEVEGESDLGFSSDLFFCLVQARRVLVLNSFFGNKAIRGSLPPLYDFFHSWKIHLS